MHEETSPYGALQREKKTPGSVGWMHRPLAYIDVFYVSLSLKKYFALLKEVETDCKGWQKYINYCLLNIYLNAQKNPSQIILQKVQHDHKCLPCYERVLKHLLHT